MALSAANIRDKVKKAAKTAVNMNEAKVGGDYKPPVPGLAMLRFVGWIELGAHESEYKGQKKTTYKAEAVFELHGKKYPVAEFEGKKIPQRITVKLNLPDPGKQPSAKSTVYKLFKAMNYENKATHIAELLGNAYLGNVFNREWSANGKKGVSAQFNDPNVEESPLTIRSPHIEIVGEDGEVETKLAQVPPQISETRLFLWDTPDAEQWESIYIAGQYENDDGTKKSKNVWQDKIRASVAFEGSEVEALLLGNPDTGDAENVDDDAPPVEEAKPKATKAADKPAKATKTAQAASKEGGSTKGSGKGKKADSAPEKPAAANVAENPLSDLEDLDDDIPF